MEPETDLCARVDRLAASVARLEERLALLEKPVAPVPLPEPPPPAEARALDLMPLGQSVVALGGAYLLRAITELDAVPDGLGVLLGLVYAAAVLALADHAIARGRRTAGAFRAATALLIAYPLIGEMVARFRVVPAAVGAVALLGWCAATCLLAARRRDPLLAWIAIPGTAVAAVAMAFVTHAPLPYLWALAALGAGAIWLGDRLEQRLLAVPPALLADLMLLLILPLVLGGRAPWPTVPALALVTFLVFAGGTMARVRAGRVLGWFEIAQSAIAFVVGFGGGAWVAAERGDGPLFGAVGLVLGTAGTVWSVRRGAFWLSLWWAAAMIALPAVTTGPLLALAYAAIGVGLVTARRWHPLAEAHGVLTLLAAAAASGLLEAAGRGLVSPPATLAAPPSGAVLVLAALVLATALVMRGADRRRGALVTRLVALVAALLGAGGLLATTAILLAEPSPASAATLRTAILAVAATGLAAASRSARAWPAGALVYPMLAAGALKLVAQDFVVGIPATQFAGLVVFGLALIVAPRLRGRAARCDGTGTG